ncbi:MULTISPECIES: STAS domain-containing protein [Streptomyces]|nr:MULTISPECIES: STAS domain-containing protein [Streptomyces]
MTAFPEAPRAVSPSVRADDAGISVSVRRSNADRTVVGIGGELDIAAVMELRTALAEEMAACEAGRGLALDLSEVTFCDSTGLNTLLRARQRALKEHRSLTITAASPQVIRLLEITGADRLFVEGAGPIPQGTG